MSFTNPFLRLFVLIGMSVLMHFFIRGKVRDFLTPWAFGYLMVHFNLSGFAVGQFHFVLMCCYWLAAAFVMDGLQLNKLARNPVMSSVLCLWLYMMITTFYCNEVYFGVAYFANIFIELVFVGYMAGEWVLSHPDGLRRLLLPCAFLFPLVFLHYQRYGFTAGELDAAGRAVLDAEKMAEDTFMNVNAIGILMATYFAALICLSMNLFKAKCNIIIKIYVWVCALASAYLLLRTGSRNAGLAFLPCGWYVLLGFRMRKAIILRIVVIGMALLAILYIVQRSFTDEGAEVRTFRFEGRTGEFDLDSISSGRIDGFMATLEDMKETTDHIFGKGIEVIRTEGMSPHVVASLSVYVTLYHRAGIVGAFLLLAYFMMMCGYGFSHGNRGRTALMLFGVWAITGVAEGVGIGRGSAIHLIWGMSLAFCSSRFFENGESFGDWSPVPARYNRPQRSYGYRI